MAPKVEKSGSKRARTETGSSSQPSTRSNARNLWPRDENTPIAIAREFADSPRKVLMAKDVDNRDISNEWDDYDSLLYNQWLRVVIAPTRYAHPLTMHRFDIKEEAIGLLKKVGLKKFVVRDDDLYPDLVRQSFASVRLHCTALDPEKKDDPSVWVMSFMANGVRHEISARDVCRVFEFPEDRLAGDLPAQIDGGEQTLWSRIGVGEYNAAKSTHTDVRHPLIRYLVRLFSTTILCKLEPGKMRKHELVLLSYALRDIVPNATWAGYDPNMGMVFMKHLHSLRHTSLSQTLGNKQFTAGSMLTPIFKFCGVDTAGYSVDRTVVSMNLEYLGRTGWVKSEKEWVFPIALGQQRMVELPLPDLMKVSQNPDLLLFEPDETLIRPVEGTRRVITRGSAGASTSRATTSHAPPQQHRFPSPPRGQMSAHEQWVTKALQATWDAIATLSRCGCVRPRTPSPPRHAAPEEEED